MKRLAAFTGAALLFACLHSGGTRAEGEPVTPRIVAQVGAALMGGDLAGASGLVAQYRRLNGDTPEALEALSWVARGELMAGRMEDARKHAEEIKAISQKVLATRSLDSEPHLPLALGAAYEVEAQILTAEHKRSEAVEFLESALHTWRGTSITERLRKNLNLLTLEGRPVPALEETEWIGKRPASLSSLRGKTVLLFFWAHWCADCKEEAPIIAKLAVEFAPKGLVVLAPTQHYGYTAAAEHASKADETAFIEKVYARFYSGIPLAGIPVSEANFERFGVSTTPTLVLVDRHGIVRLYHPGGMEESTLRAAIEPLLVTTATARATG